MKTAMIQIMAGAAMLSSATYVPILARDTLGADELFVTLIVAVYAITSFVATYVFGRAGDIYGRRLILRIGLFAALVSFALLIVVDTLEGLFIVRMINGFCIGIYPGALTAYAYESKMPMGKFAAFGALGWGGGTLLSGFAATFEIHQAFLVSTLFLVGALASAIALPPLPGLHMRIPLFPVETIKQNMPIFVAMLIRQGSASAVWALWPLFLADLGGDDFAIGVIQALNSVVQVLFMAGLTDRFTYRPLILAGLVGSAVTFGWLMLVSNIIEVLPTQIVLGFAWSCFYVGSLKYVTDRNVEKSTASGLLQSVIAISGIIGPVIAAVLYTLWPSYQPILFAAFAMSIVALVVFRAADTRNEEQLKSADMTRVPDALLRPVAR